MEGGKVWMSFVLDNQETVGSCTAENVSALTAGFTVVSANTPVTVAPGTYGSLNFTVQTPWVMPVGSVTFVVTVLRP